MSSHSDDVVFHRIRISNFVHYCEAGDSSPHTILLFKLVFGPVKCNRYRFLLVIGMHILLLLQYVKVYYQQKYASLNTPLTELYTFKAPVTMTATVGIRVYVVIFLSSI